MKNHFLLAALFLLPASAAAADESPSLPTAEEIVDPYGLLGTCSARSPLRDMPACGGTSSIISNFHKRAEMLVQVQGDPDGTKHFEVVSEEGWKAAHKHVLRKMLESESETSHPDMRAKTRINPENYDFEMAGTELIDGRTAYVLEKSAPYAKRFTYFAAASGWTRRITRWSAQRASLQRTLRSGRRARISCRSTRKTALSGFPVRRKASRKLTFLAPRT